MRSTARCVQARTECESKAFPPPGCFGAMLMLTLCLSGVPGPASALTYLSIEDSDLADQATAIAEIDVLSMSPAAGTALPSTEYVVLVERVLKGSLDATAVIRVLGGEREDGMRFVVPGAPSSRGREGARFPRARPRRRLLRSPFHARRLPSHRRRADEPHSRCATSASAFAVAAIRDRLADHERDYERFATWLADRARGARRAADYLRPVTAQTSRAIVERFRLFADSGLSFRWFDFDGGVSVGFGFNGAGSVNPARDRDAFQQASPPGTTIQGRTSTTPSSATRSPDSFPGIGRHQRRRFGDPNGEIEAASTAAPAAAGHRRRALRRLDWPLRRRSLVPHPRGRHRGAGRRRLRAPEQRAARSPRS